MTAVTVGVDVGGTHIRGGPVVDGRVVEVVRRRHREALDAVPSYPDLVDGIAELVTELATRHEVAAVGVSMAGTLSADRSQVISTIHPSWQGQALPSDLAARIGLPVVMENDGNCATWAEYCSGPGCGSDPFAMLTLGTGVGGGIVANGRLVRGRHGFAGELGHLCVVEPAGFPCACGAAGCLEQYASGRSIIARFSAGPDGAWRGAAGWRFTGRPGELRAAESLLIARLADGDPWAQRVVDDAGRAVAAGIAALVRVLDLDTVAIGGGAASLGEPLIEAIRRGVTDYPGAPSRRLAVQVRPAEHGEYAGLAGAALLAQTSGVRRASGTGEVVGIALP